MAYERATSFQATRQQHASEAAQDYTELVSILVLEKGEARTCDIARHLGISHVTALRTLRRLAQQGFVRVKPHSPIELTPKGEQLAERCRHRHSVVMDFLLSIGVPPGIAQSDSEGIEHHISDTTLECLEALLSKRKR